LMMFKNWRWTSPFFWHGFNFVLNLWAERTWTWKTMDNDCQVFTLTLVDICVISLFRLKGCGSEEG
jgi:hypothetical protein